MNLTVRRVGPADFKLFSPLSSDWAGLIGLRTRSKISPCFHCSHHIGLFLRHIPDLPLSHPTGSGKFIKKVTDNQTSALFDIKITYQVVIGSFQQPCKTNGNKAIKHLYIHTWDPNIGLLTRIKSWLCCQSEIFDIGVQIWNQTPELCKRNG